MDSKQQNQRKPIKQLKEEPIMKEGLFIAGAISGRTKRMVGIDRQKELITYKLQTPEAIFYIKDWDSNEQYFQVGEVVQLPIRISSYTSNGSTRIDYTISRPREQEF